MLCIQRAGLPPLDFNRNLNCVDGLDQLQQSNKYSRQNAARDFFNKVHISDFKLKAAWEEKNKNKNKNKKRKKEKVSVAEFLFQRAKETNTTATINNNDNDDNGNIQL